MSITLKPIGDYYYDPDALAFDDAWAELEKALQDKHFVVCKVLAFSEQKGYLEVEYHHIRGKIERGYITSNRYLSSEYFVGKTCCVQVTKLNKRNRSFRASRLLVEVAAKEKVKEFIPGTQLDGRITYIARNDASAFVDVMEGITYYLSESHITWKPKGCQRITDRFSVGNRVTGYIIFIEPEISSHTTAGRISCVNLKDNWAAETNHLTIGTVVEGSAHPAGIFSDKYYISLSDLVYIEFYSPDAIRNGTKVQIKITERCDTSYRILGEFKRIVFSEEPSPVPPQPEPQPKPQPKPQPEPQPDTYPDEYITTVKATVSPFAMRDGEQKKYESTPNKIPSAQQLQSKFRTGQITELHFRILEAVNALVFCTSKMIMEYLSFKGSLPEKTSRDKLNTRLSSMVNNGMLDRLRFSNDESNSLFRVYFLAKNGHDLLQVYRGTKKTSYEPMMLATPEADLKRQLATNQIIIAHMQTFPFFISYSIRKVYNASEETPIRVPARLTFENSNLLLETQRRYAGWQELLLNKADRYLLFLQNHQNGTLPSRSQFLLGKRMYLLLVCEDKTHAEEIRDLLYGHALYPYLFFTYDLLVFQQPVNESIFNFGSDGSIIYYDVTELLQYNIQKSVNAQQEKPRDTSLDEFFQCLKRSPALTLQYLQAHDSAELREYVQKELTDLYQIDSDGKYVPVHPESEQYYVWLLYVISHDLLKETGAAFTEGEISELQEAPRELPEPAPATRIDPKDLEQAVRLVVSRLETYITVTVHGTIGKHSVSQTSGTQFGYDVGMDFRTSGMNYHLGFECKSYQTLREKNNSGGDSRLRVSEYGKNLLQYYMYCERGSGERNYWILVSPYADLQNDFQRNLFDRWNAEIPFMKLKAITLNETEISCEEFFSLDPEAYRMVYQRTRAELPEDEKTALSKKIYDYIVGDKTVSQDITISMKDYPFPNNIHSIPDDQRLTLRTADGKDIQQSILQALNNRLNVFLIGEYGCGKTCMTYHLVETILSNPAQYGFFPLWFQLVDQKACDTSDFRYRADEFVAQGYNRHSDKIRNQLQSTTKCPLVILDGLDEISSGLGGSVTKVELLVEIIKAAKRKIMKSNTLFLISSREVDFNSCISSISNVPDFEHSKKIMIGDCRIEDAVNKLQAVEYESSRNSDSLTQKTNLMQIAKKPLYFGFLREIIYEHVGVQQIEQETDLLHEIITRSIKRSLDNSRHENSSAENDILNWLADAAVDISRQRTNGEQGAHLVNRHWAGPEYLKNVVRITEIRGREYHVTFYHNAIREYLVAYLLSQEAKNCIRKGHELTDVLAVTLQDVALTPETIAFFCALIQKDKDDIAWNLKKLLQKATSEEYQRMGTNILSILSRLAPDNPGIRRMELQGIYAYDLHLYRCSLENLNLQNAHLRNLHLFDVTLSNIDFRGADLHGLVMGQYGGVVDFHHRKEGSRVSIFGLYENQHLVEYRFPDIQEGKFDIIPHALPSEKYPHLCSIEENAALYDSQKVIFTDDSSYSIPADCRLLKMTHNAVVMETQNGYTLTYHRPEYKEAVPFRLTPSQAQTVCCLDRECYLYRDDHRLCMNLRGKLVEVTTLTSTFECYTAAWDCENKSVCVYIKYSEGIQEIHFQTETQQIADVQNKSIPGVTYQEMAMIDSRWMYAMSDQTIFLLDLAQQELQPLTMKTQVHTQKLLLQEHDGSRRVTGDAEYQMLKEAEQSYTDTLQSVI